MELTGSMSEQPAMVGRVLRSSTTSFSIGCSRLIAEQSQTAPEFGALVKALNGDGSAVYALIYNETIEDDAFVRQLVAAGVDNAEYVEDQRQNRQIPIVVDVLVVGSGRGTNISHRLPPRPPGALDRIYACNNAEVARFSARHDWLRTVLAAADVPTEQLVAAALRKAAAARPPDQREGYLVEAGRELARWLAADLTRLDGILQQLREEI
jgi:hypothetical protein